MKDVKSTLEDLESKVSLKRREIDEHAARFPNHVQPTGSVDSKMKTLMLSLVRSSM